MPTTSNPTPFGQGDRQWPGEAWTPVRNGDTYCSPACGMGCTWAEYQAAVAWEKTLHEQLGDGWALRVFENFGWHVEATRGACVVHRAMSVMAWNVYLNLEPQVTLTVPDERGADGVYRAKTSWEAVTTVIGQALAKIDAMQRSIDQILAND